jgi:Alcohol dehydrogenase GroES-like domain
MRAMTQRARFDWGRCPARPDRQGADRRGGAGRPGLCVRVGPLILPERVGPRRGSIGHEFIGVVEALGDDVIVVTPGDLVIAPIIHSDGTCPHCQNWVTISCVAGSVLRP